MRLTSAPDETYDLNGNVLADTVLVQGTLASSIATGKQANLFSAQPTVTLVGTAQVRCYDFQLTISGSDANCNGYGVIGSVDLAGAGSTKAVYGRAGFVASATGTAIGVNAAVRSVSTAANAYALTCEHTGPNATNSAHIVCAGDSTNRIKNGLLFLGSNDFISTVVQWNQHDATEGASFLRILDSVGNIIFDVGPTGKIDNHGGTQLVGNGIGVIVAKANLTTQGAAIGATTIYAVPTSGQGMYRINWAASVTRAATTSSTLGGSSTTGFRATYTDPNDSVAKTTSGFIGQTNSGNTTGAAASGSVVAYCKASTNLQYQYDYASSGATSMQYDLHIIVEYLG